MRRSSSSSSSLSFTDERQVLFILRVYDTQFQMLALGLQKEWISLPEEDNEDRDLL